MTANAQITEEPYRGARHQSFRQFEHLFRGFIGVATIPANQTFCDSTSETPRYDIFKSYPMRPEMILNEASLHSGTTSRIKIFKKYMFLNSNS